MGIVETPVARVVVEKLKKTMDVTAQMRELTRSRERVAPNELDLANKILDSLSDVIDYLQRYESTDDGSVGIVPPGTDSGGQRRKRKAGGGAPRKRSHPYSFTTKSSTLEDGHKWRKYGQKNIQDSKYPRSYYRCSYDNTRGCKAKRQAQQMDDDPGTYTITFLGHHTCKEDIRVAVSDIGNDHHSSSGPIEGNIPPEQRVPELSLSPCSSTNDNVFENLGGPLVPAGQTSVMISTAMMFEMAEELDLVNTYNCLEPIV